MIRRLIQPEHAVWKEGPEGLSFGVHTDRQIAQVGEPMSLTLFIRNATSSEVEIPALDSKTIRWEANRMGEIEKQPAGAEASASDFWIALGPGGILQKSQKVKVWSQVGTYKVHAIFGSESKTRPFPRTRSEELLIQVIP